MALPPADLIHKLLTLAQSHEVEISNVGVYRHHYFILSLVNYLTEFLHPYYLQLTT